MSFAPAWLSADLLIACLVAWRPSFPRCGIMKHLLSECAVHNALILQNVHGARAGGVCSLRARGCRKDPAWGPMVCASWHRNCIYNACSICAMHARPLAMCCLLSVSIAFAGSEFAAGKNVVVYLKPADGLSAAALEETKNELVFVMRGIGMC